MFNFRKPQTYQGETSLPNYHLNLIIPTLHTTLQISLRVKQGTPVRKRPALMKPDSVL